MWLIIANHAVVHKYNDNEKLQYYNIKHMDNISMHIKSFYLFCN